MPGPKRRPPADLFRRYQAARHARLRGADPYLAFSYVLWPTPDIKAAYEKGHERRAA